MVEDSCKVMRETLEKQITIITEEIEKIIEADSILKEKHTTLKTIDGIGNLVALELLILLPELGQLTRRQIASLAGLAPMANDSGR